MLPSFRAKAASLSRPAQRRRGPPQSRNLLFLLALFLAPALHAQDTGWIIESFHADYVINTDRSIDVTEWIKVDFGPLQRHGIYRDILTKYRRVARAGVPIPAGTEKVDISLRTVTNEQQQELGTDITRGGGSTRIRIGDPDTQQHGSDPVGMLRFVSWKVQFKPFFKLPPDGQ